MKDIAEQALPNSSQRDQLQRAKALLVDIHKISSPGIQQLIEQRTGPWLVWGVDRDAETLPAPSLLPASTGQLQERVQPWLLECFGPTIAADRKERNHRFLEEAIELVQACGCSASEAHQLVDYVYGRPVGEPDQEVGGVMITLAALCLANGLDMHDAGERELARIWTMVEKIRAKQAAKPKHSPLPTAPAASGLRFPTMLRKMWSGAEVQAWLDEQGELIRLRDIPEGCTPTDARVLREANHALATQLSALSGYQPTEGEAVPIDMVLHCPACGLQHIDAPEWKHQFADNGQGARDEAEAREAGMWVNDPHRSHLCHGCGHIWRPADVPTNGVKAVKTRGQMDSVPVFDLDLAMWRSIQQAARESKWIPTEYFANDWTNDVCRFLRDGAEAFHQAEPVRWLLGVRGEPLKQHAVYEKRPTEEDIDFVSRGSHVPLDQFVVTPIGPLSPSVAARPSEVPPPIELQGIAATIEQGGGLWRTCSGCHESNEGWPTGAFSQVMKCHLGNGCDECGGIGAIWDTTDYEEMALAIAAADDAEQPAEASVAWQALDEALLKAIEAGNAMKGGCWIYAPAYSQQPLIGTYEWLQGRSPHWFSTADCGRVNALNVTHVAPFKRPALPAGEAA